MCNGRGGTHVLASRTIQFIVDDIRHLTGCISPSVGHYQPVSLFRLNRPMGVLVCILSHNLTTEPLRFRGTRDHTAYCHKTKDKLCKGRFTSEGKNVYKEIMELILLWGQNASVKHPEEKANKYTSHRQWGQRSPARHADELDLYQD